MKLENISTDVTFVVTYPGGEITTTDDPVLFDDGGDVGGQIEASAVDSSIGLSVNGEPQIVEGTPGETRAKMSKTTVGCVVFEEVGNPPVTIVLVDDRKWKVSVEPDGGGGQIRRYDEVQVTVGKDDQ